MKSVMFLLTFVTILTTNVWTPEPTPAPQVQELGMTTIVGNQAVFLIDKDTLKAKNGSDVDLKELFPPESYVEDWQYYMEKSLKELELPKGTTSIGRFGFARSGITRINIPVGVTEIGYAAFYHCDDLCEVTIPHTVTSIDSKAFQYTPWMDAFLKGESHPGTDFLIVGDGILLAYRGNAETVVIPEGVKTIADGAFAYSSERKEVIYPSTMNEQNNSPE